jgi:methionine aminopeptidase
MRVVCRLAREVLDIAARALKPGVTTDQIDEIVHKACVERDVRYLPWKLRGDHVLICNTSSSLVISLAVELHALPQVRLHIRQRDHLPRYP